MKRNKEMQKVLDTMTKQMFGRTMSDADDICVTCGNPKGKFRNEISKKEWGISKMCQECQDGVFGVD